MRRHEISDADWARVEPLLPAPDADITHADALLDGTTPAVVIADTGYDKQALVDALEAKGREAVIPTRSNRTVQREIDTDRYKDRNLPSGSGPRSSSTGGSPPGMRRPPATSWRSSKWHP